MVDDSIQNSCLTFLEMWRTATSGLGAATQKDNELISINEKRIRSRDWDHISIGTIGEGGGGGRTEAAWG